MKQAVPSVMPHPNTLLGVPEVDPYGADLKIAVLASDIALINTAPFTCGFSLLPLAIRNDKLEYVKTHTSVVLDSAPVHVIAIAVAKENSHCNELRAVWTREYGNDLPPTINLNTTRNTTSALLETLRVSLDYVKRNSHANVALRRQLYSIRAEHEHLQEAFRRLEAYAQATFSLSQNLALSLEPSEDIPYYPVTPGQEYTQCVPISSVGLAEFAIQCFPSALDPTGELNVALITSEDNKTHGNWTVSATALSDSKWTRFSLPKCLGTDARTPLLQLKWRGQASLLLKASLHHPEDKWNLQSDDDRSHPSIVAALRVWRGLPGMLVQSSGQSLIPDAASERTILLASDTLRGVRALTPVTQFVQYVADDNSVLVHPSRENATIAILENAIPQGTQHVWADVETVNDQAGNVQYSIALATSASADLSGSVNILARSNWVNLPARDKSQVHLFLRDATLSRAHLILTTRVKQGDSIDHCWARFQKIYLSAIHV